MEQKFASYALVTIGYVTIYFAADELLEHGFSGWMMNLSGDFYRVDLML